MAYALMTDKGFAIHSDDGTIVETIEAPFTTLIEASRPPFAIEIESSRGWRKMEFRLVPHAKVDFGATFIPPSMLKTKITLPDFEIKHAAMIRRIGTTPKRRERVERFLREIDAGKRKPEAQSNDYQALRTMFEEHPSFRKYVSDTNPRWLITRRSR
jgi:hypothetical protein